MGYEKYNKIVELISKINNQELLDAFIDYQKELAQNKQDFIDNILVEIKKMVVKS